MKYYRIVFAKNEIISCTETIEHIVQDLPIHEVDRGQLIFALVKAEDEEDAREIANKIVADVKKSHSNITE